MSNPSARFRYRIFGQGKVFAGCADLEDARAFAELLRSREKAAFVIYQHEQGEKPREVAWYPPEVGSQP
jgi:hypothetical protein